MRRLTLIGLATLLAVSCGINKNTDPAGDAPVVLRMDKIQGAEVLTVPPVWYDHVLSDVHICGTVINDDALLSFDVVAKNPDYAQTGPTGLNDVLLQSYTVHFIRTDGHQMQGVDVPYDFSGALSGVVALHSTTPMSSVIVVVRHSAKLEPPLSALVGMGGESLIDTVAQITAYGRTSNGANVQATGYLQVTFADFADPTTCSFATPSATPTPTPVPTATP